MSVTLEDIGAKLDAIMARFGIQLPPPTPAIAPRSATIRTKDPTGREAVAQLQAENPSGFALISLHVQAEDYYPGWYDATVVYAVA